MAFHTICWTVLLNSLQTPLTALVPNLQPLYWSTMSQSRGFVSSTAVVWASHSATCFSLSSRGKLRCMSDFWSPQTQVSAALLSTTYECTQTAFLFSNINTRACFHILNAWALLCHISPFVSKMCLVALRHPGCFPPVLNKNFLAIFHWATLDNYNVQF